MITSIAFTVCPGTDMAQARHFYEGVLGLKVSHNFRDEWVEHDLGDSTFAVSTMDMQRTPGAKGAGVGFETPDLDSFADTFKQKTVTFILDTISTPVCRMAVVEDPDGNHIVIHKRHEGPRSA